VPKLKLGKITSGPLTVAIESDDRGRLYAVHLPGRLPPGLSAAHLSAVLAELEQRTLAIDASRPFYRRVWQRMRTIPWGSASTYGGLAAALGSPHASRAVGQACGSNPLPLIIPCHRVIGTQGPGGFASGLAWKNKLLELETEPRPRS
jgi:O-6-methylguanine DNA methyltransferase